MASHVRRVMCVVGTIWSVSRGSVAVGQASATMMPHKCAVSDHEGEWFHSCETCKPMYC